MKLTALLSEAGGSLRSPAAVLGMRRSLKPRLGRLPPHEQAFAREGEEVRWYLHVAFVRHSDDVDLILDVAVRHHAIENRKLTAHVDYGVF